MSNKSQQPYIYKYCLDYYNTNLLNSRYLFLITFKERINRRLIAIKFQCRVSVTVSLYHLMLYQVHLVWVGFELTISVVIGTDCIGNCKSNYDMIMTTTAPSFTNRNCWKKSEKMASKPNSLHSVWAAKYMLSVLKDWIWHFC